jgi:simple sugar transport system substrate-binding protein
VLSGEMVNWTVMYDKILSDIHAGTWTNADMFWAAKDGAALLGGNLTETVNPKFVEALKAVTIKGTDLGDLSAYDLVMKRYEAIKAGTFNYATGPIKAQDGTEKYAPGVAAPLADLLSVNWFVDNVKGEVPKS